MAYVSRTFGRRAHFDARSAAPASHDGTGVYRCDYITQPSYTVGSEGLQKTFSFTSLSFADNPFPPGPPALGMELTIRQIRFVLELLMNAAYTKLSLLQRVIIYIDETPEVGPEDLNAYDLHAPLFSSPRYTIILDQLVKFQRPSLAAYEAVFEFNEHRDIRLHLSGEGPAYDQSKRVYCKIVGHSFTQCVLRPACQLFVSPTRLTDSFHPREIEESETILFVSD